MMRSIVCFGLCVLLAIVSCSRSNNNNEKENDTQQTRYFLNKLNVISVGYEYDLVLQDGENCYQTTQKDSMYFPEYTYVIGVLSDTTKYYNILYLEPGDDLYPTLRVFSKSGDVLNTMPIAYGDCASGECGLDSCASHIRVVAQSSIERWMTKANTKCDSLGNKTSEEASSVEKSQIIRVNLSGGIELGVEEIK